jgi:hypothetical protein
MRYLAVQIDTDDEAAFDAIVEFLTETFPRDINTPVRAHQVVMDGLTDDEFGDVQHLTH